VTQLRLTRMQVAGAGLALAVGICALFFFMLIKPTWGDIAQTTQQAKTTEDQVRAEKPKAEKDLAAAKINEVKFRKQYDEIMKKRMPDISFEDPLSSMFALQQVPGAEGRLIAAWFNSTGADVRGYSFPAFGTSLPDPAAHMLPPLTWNLSVTVPDFPAFLEWLEKLPEAPRFLVLNSVTIPGMRQPGTPCAAGVSVTLYEWLKTPRGAAAAAASQAAGAAAAPAAAGAGTDGRGRGRGAGGRWG
jgi:hypothetical protein